MATKVINLFSEMMKTITNLVIPKKFRGAMLDIVGEYHNHIVDSIDGFETNLNNVDERLDDLEIDDDEAIGI